jgi:arginine exporter protein ArgO
VHAAVLQLAPVLAAAKSKVPYYAAGGLLVSWALFLSLGLGLRKPEFPGSASGQRAVIAVTAVLVVATVSMAVVTSGGPG